MIVAYNDYGFRRSSASNIVTVGAPNPDLQPLVVTAFDGEGAITVRFPTPKVGGRAPAASRLACAGRRLVKRMHAMRLPPHSLLPSTSSGTCPHPLEPPQLPYVYNLQGNGPDGSFFYAFSVPLSAVAVSDDGATTEIFVGAGLPGLVFVDAAQNGAYVANMVGGLPPSRYSVQVEPTNPWSSAVGMSAIKYACTGAPAGRLGALGLGQACRRLLSSRAAQLQGGHSCS